MGATLGNPYFLCNKRGEDLHTFFFLSLSRYITRGIISCLLCQQNTRSPFSIYKKKARAIGERKKNELNPKNWLPALR